MADAVEKVTDLVMELRPEWDEYVVRAMARDLSQRLPLDSWVPAVIRGAATPDLPQPRAILWRGPHWDHTKQRPPEVQERDRCDVCGKVESRCVMARPGVDDDHPFTPKRRTA